MKKIIIHYVPKSHISKDEYLMKQYDILAEETSMRVNLLWSVPSLLFVAISFLLITSWDGNFSPWFRFIASFISAVLCVCIWMLFERLWYFECAANEQMASIEKYFSEKFRWEVPFIHTSITKKTDANGNSLLINNHTKLYRSHAVWRIAFAMMLIVSIATAIFVFCKRLPL